MFQEFMQMGFPAALAILFIAAAPTTLYLVVSWTKRANKEAVFDHEIKIMDRAYQAKQIEAKAREK